MAFAFNSNSNFMLPFNHGKIQNLINHDNCIFSHAPPPIEEPVPLSIQEIPHFEKTLSCDEYLAHSPILRYNTPDIQMDAIYSNVVEESIPNHPSDSFQESDKNEVGEKLEFENNENENENNVQLIIENDNVFITDSVAEEKPPVKKSNSFRLLVDTIILKNRIKKNGWNSLN